MPVNPDTLDKALAHIRKQYGPGSVVAGDETPFVSRIPTGALELDLATNGGIPIGRWTHKFGGYMSAKTLTSWNIIANAQELGMTCAYYNIEKQYDKDWVARRGIKTKDLVVVEKTAIEDVGTAMEALLPSVHLHVLDSMAAAVALDELAADLDEWRPGRAAAAWSKTFRRINERFDDRENTIIMINQVRDVFQAGRSGGEAPPGGRMVDFMSSLSLHFKRSSWLFRDKNGDLHPEGTSEASLSGDTTPSGLEFQVRVAKSRVGPPLRTARLRLDFATGEFDHMWTLVKAAKFYNLFNKTSEKSSWYELPDGTKVQGEVGIRERLREDTDLVKEIEEKLNGGTALAAV